MSQISEKIGMITSMFSGKSPKSPHNNAEFYKNKYIEELEHRVQMNEKLAQKDELISTLLSRIRELEGGEEHVDNVKSKSPLKLDSPAKKRLSPPRDKDSPGAARVSPVAQRVSPVSKKVSPVRQALDDNLEEVSHSVVVENTQMLEQVQVPDKEEEEVFQDLDGDALVAWNDVIKESHPGSLGQMPAVAKQRLEAAFTEFLLENMPEDKVKRCKVMNEKNKIVVALPESLQESFGEWLDNKIEDGMLDRGPLAKWKEEQARLSGKASPKRRESGKVQVEKEKLAVKKKKIAKETTSFPGWIPWVEIVEKKFSDLNLNLPQFALFVKAFVLSNSLEERKLSVPGVDIKVLAIPEEMADNFIECFSEKFKYMKSIQAVLEKEQRGEKRDSFQLDDSSEQIRKISRTDAKHVAINDSGLELYNKVLESVMPKYPETSRDFRLEFKNRAKEYLIEKVGGMETFREECALRYIHGNQARSTFGIPPRLKKDFMDWAATELKKKFGDAALL